MDFEPHAPPLLVSPFWCPFVRSLFPGGLYHPLFVLLNAVYKLVLMYSNCLLSGTMMVHVKEEGDRCVQEVRDVELIFTIVCGVTSKPSI